jgi:hypothetical protein
MSRFAKIASVAIAISFGFFVLTGYLFGHNADGTLSFLGELQLFILNVAVALAGFTVLVGVFNLSAVHFNKIRHNEKGAIYSAILVLAMTGTFLLGLVSHFIPQLSQYFSGLFDAVILPVETSLMAILAVSLTYASIRLLRRRMNLFSVIFLVTALLVLLGAAPLPFLGDTFLGRDLRPIITQVLAASGARGILIGVALGTLTVGLRILIGSDRPYGGEK